MDYDRDNDGALFILQESIMVEMHLQEVVALDQLTLHSRMINLF